jgi:hypothetical protein
MHFQLNRLGFKEENASANLYVFQKDLTAGLYSNDTHRLTNAYLVPQRSDSEFKLWYRFIFHSLDSCKITAELETQHASRIIWDWALVLFYILFILPDKAGRVGSIHAILPHAHQAKCAIANISDGTNLYETWRACKASSFDGTDVLWEASVLEGRVCEAGLKKLRSYMGTKLWKVSWRKGVEDHASRSMSSSHEAKPADE